MAHLPSPLLEQRHQLLAPCRMPLDRKPFFLAVLDGLLEQLELTFGRVQPHASLVAFKLNAARGLVGLGHRFIGDTHQ